MNLLENLEAAIDREESFFRSQLMREDVARLRQLQELAGTSQTVEEFVKEGLYIGWTPNDMRTHEFKDELEAFLRAVYRQVREDDETDEADEQIDRTWRTFDAKRMERLVGCLTRVPKPGEL